MRPAISGAADTSKATRSELRTSPRRAPRPSAELWQRGARAKACLPAIGSATWGSGWSASCLDAKPVAQLA